MLSIVERIAQDRRWRESVFVLVAALAVIVYLETGSGGFPLDDSWIHQVYARNLAERGEWAFVSGEPSGASTSPLFTLVLAIGYLLPISYTVWTPFVGFVALALAGILAARMADFVIPALIPAQWFTGLTVILAWHLIWSAVSGMETMLFSTLTLAMFYLTWREAFTLPQERLWKRGAAFGLLTSVMIATRPEGALLAAICAGLLLLAKADSTRLAVSAGVAFTLGFLPYLALNLALNGSLFPNTSAAKQAQHWPIIERVPFVDRLFDMVLPVTVGVQALLIPGVLFLMGWALWRILKGERAKWVMVAPLAWMIALSALYAWRLPASYQHGRYLIPALPGMIAVGVIGTAWMFKLTRSIVGLRIVPMALAYGTPVLLLVFAFGLGLNAYHTDLKIINEEMVAQAEWIRDHVPPDELLAIHDIGAVGYFAPRPIVDIAGLVTPEVVDLIGNPDALWAYMEARGAVYLMAFPDQIPNQDVSDPRLCFYHETSGTTVSDMGEGKMTLYRLAWDGVCPVEGD